MLNSPLRQQLSAIGVPDERINKAQILCLPENILRTAKREELRETTDATILIKQLREKSVEVFSLFDVGLDLPAVDRRAKDKWLGTVWVRDYAAMPILTSLIAGYLVLEFPVHFGKASEQNVHLDLVVGEKDEKISLKYAGDGQTLVRVLDAIKDDKGNHDRPARGHH